MMLAYCSSKAALNTFTILLAKELKPDGVRVNSICPGYVNTELNGNSGVLTTDESAKNIVPFIMNENAGTGLFAQADGEYPW
jgi:NAD(P)-dependent dehydrogenase (short-subunit alcohol dehydrogenase family)